MPLLKNGEYVEDNFSRVLDDEPLPPPAHGVIVSWERFRKDRAALAGHPGGLGVLFPVSADPEELVPYIDALNVIVLPFAAFTDGRAYSLAHIIRDRLEFKGELRATGDLLADQVGFMRQVGFDAFEIRSDRQPLDVWQRAATAMSLTYQRGFAPQRGFSPADIYELRATRNP